MIRTSIITMFINTGTKQCTIIRFARYPSETANAWFSQRTYVYICGAYISNRGTYGTRKYSSWCPDIHKSKDPKYKIKHSKNPKIQTSKTPKLQNFKHPKTQKSKAFRIYGILQKNLDFWILIFFGFLCFLCFWDFRDFWICGSVALCISGHQEVHFRVL